MRFIIGFLSGVLGALAGWAGLAILVISLAGPDRDGGIAMGAFFNIGPIGGVIGFVVGVLLFVKFGTVAQAPSAQAMSAETSSPDAVSSDVATAVVQSVARQRVSRPFAVAVVAIVAGLAWWGWYELIRSPYLSHGYMTLELQFRLPPGMELPADEKDIHITVEEGSQYAEAMFGPRWRAHDGDRRAMIVTASLSRKTTHRVVRLEMPGVPEQSWTVNLPSDPDPTPGYSPWQLGSATAAAKIDMHFRLTADH